MAESVTIANAALVHLGGQLITALTDTSREAKFCNERIAKARKAVLRMHPWNFAMKRKYSTVTWGSIQGMADSGSGEIRVNITAHTFSTGDRVTIKDAETTTEANGTWRVTKIDADHFDLDDSTFTNVSTSDGVATFSPAFQWTYRILLETDCLRVVEVGFDGEDVEYELEGRYILTDQESIDYRYIYDCSDDTLFDTMFATCFALYLAWDLSQVFTQSDQMRENLLNEFKVALAKARHVDATENPARMLQAEDFVDAHLGGNLGFVRDPMTS
jgi:hypothetical protein